MTNELRDKAKRRIFDAGVGAIEALLGRPLEFKNDCAMSKAMDEALVALSDEEVKAFCEKHCKMEVT